MVHQVRLSACTASVRAADVRIRSNAAELAQAKLASSPYWSLRALSCDDHEGVLALRGQVPTYYLKQLAQTVVRDVPGVEVINNQVLVVRLEPRRFPPDNLVAIDL
jgi:osmotically-inducible protein OsmY